MAFLPDGHSLAVASPANRLQILDLRRVREELEARSLDFGLGDLGR